MTALLLIYRGVDLYCVDTLGWSLLHSAAEHGLVEVVKELIARGHNIHVREPYGMYPLHFAALRGHNKVVIVLLEAKAEIDVVGRCSYNSHTPLPLAVRAGHRDVVNTLIQWSADLNREDRF